MEFILAFSFLLVSTLVGWLVLGLIPIEFGRWEKKLVSPALGLIVVTEMHWLLAFYLRHLASPFLAILPLIVLLIVYKISFQKKKASQDIVKIPIFWVILLLVGGYIVYVLYARVLNPGSNGELMIGPPMLYGDTPVHLSYTTKLAYGKFPPEQPIFAGYPLNYPYKLHLTYALFLNLGLPLRFAIFLPQIIFVLAFLVLLIKVWQHFVSGKGVMIAAVTFFLGWGSGFVNALAYQLSGVNFLQFSQKFGDLTHNDTFGMQLANVLTGVILPGRTILAGLVIGLLITALMLGKVSNVSQVSKVPNAFDTSGTFDTFILIGLLLGLLPLWHTHTFIFFAVAVFIWQLVFCQGSFAEKLKSIFITYTVALIFVLPQVLPLMRENLGAKFISFILGWQLKGENPFVFWFRNSLFLIPFSLVGIFFLPKRERLFLLPSFLMFIIVNFVSFQNLAWDNIKLLTWVILFWAIPVSAVYLKLLQQNLLAAGLGFLILGLSSLSGLYSITVPLSSEYVLYDKADQTLASWVKINTSPESIFLTEPIFNHPIPNLTGRSIFMGYPGTLWTYSLPYSDRERLVERIFAGEVSLVETLNPKVAYLVLTQNQLVFRKINYPLVFQNEKYRVYQVSR